MSDNDIFLKTEGSDESDGNRGNVIKFHNSKRKITSICDGLIIPSRDYLPRQSVKYIEDYINFDDKIERILYSQISSYIFSLDEGERGTFGSNVDALLMYALDDKNSVSTDCRKIIIKIYDHFNLATTQIDNIKNIFGDSIEETQKSLSSEIKSVEKEYIAILGIFASIVVTFVSGITFSASVLEGIELASKYRLVFLVILVGLVLFNAISLLLCFVWKITQNNPFKGNVNSGDAVEVRLKYPRKHKKKLSRVAKWIIAINIGFLFMLGIVFLMWGIQTDFLDSFFDEVSVFFEWIGKKFGSLFHIIKSAILELDTQKNN